MTQETIRSLIIGLICFFAIFGAAMLLTGCETAKYVECVARDNTRNPCN